MRTQIYYAFKDFLKHPLSFLMLILQMIISFYLLFYGIYSSISIKDENLKIKKMISEKNGHCFYSSRDDQTFIANTGNNKKEDAEKVYDFLDNNDNFKHLQCKIKKFEVYKDDPLSKLSNDMYINNNSDFKNEISSVFTNKWFKDIFEVDCQEGDFLSQDDFEYKDKKINIVLGNEFKRFFSVGEILKVTDTGMPIFPYEGKNIEFIIKGFLKKDSFFLRFGDGNNLVRLDKMIVFPINSRMNQHAGFKDSFGVYDECLSSFDIISDDIESSFYKINKFSAENNLSSYQNFCSWKDCYEEIVTASDERTLVSYFLFFSISGFATINLVLSLFMMINKERRKIGINILCGCTINKIILRYIFQIFGAIFISLVLAMTFSENDDFLINLIMITSSLIVVFVISFPVAKRLKKLSINSLVKRRE